jgi:hypothetical protein
MHNDIEIKTWIAINAQADLSRSKHVGGKIFGLPRGWFRIGIESHIEPVQEYRGTLLKLRYKVMKMHTKCCSE